MSEAKTQKSLHILLALENIMAPDNGTFQPNKYNFFPLFSSWKHVVGTH